MDTNGGRRGLAVMDQQVGRIDNSKSFDNRVLEGEDFRGRELSNARFRNAKLMQANFEGADLTGANFTDANCWGANFKDAKLYKATFQRAVLTGCNFEGADLRNVTITLTCDTFDKIKLSKKWLACWLWFPMLMDSPEDLREKLREVIGPERVKALDDARLMI